MIQSSRLTKQEALRAYRTVLFPSVTYPLGAIYFSPQQCNTLQNLAAQEYLPKLGFNQKLPKAILFGPTKYGGWGEKDLYIQMIIQQTKLFLGHIRNNDETGKLLISELEYT